MHTATTSLRPAAGQASPRVAPAASQGQQRAPGDAGRAPFGPAAGPDVLAHVDPFLGVDFVGECLPGPYLPLGLVRLGPDTPPPQGTNGYRSDAPILRFSHTHVSGTGGQSRYGNVGVTPFLGVARDHAGPYAKADEVAASGYYAVTLATEGGPVRCELTCTRRTGLHRYTFPAGAQANVLIDAGSVLQPIFYEGDTNGARPRCTGGYVELVGPGAGVRHDVIRALHGERGPSEGPLEVVGRGDFRGGWGHDHPYSVYFAARFDRPANVALAFSPDGQGHYDLAEGPGPRAVVGFAGGGEVNLRVGISFVSVAHARRHLDEEAEADGAPRPFDAVRSDAEDAWRRLLGRVRTEGGTPDQRKLFYTLMTRLFCMPTDLGVDDEFPLWHSGVRHFSEYYCLWDSVRNANSLIALLDPGLGADLLNCLLDVADHVGWLPDAWIAGHSAFSQGGSSADVLLCEAHLKGLPGIDWAQALRCVRKNVEQVSPDPYRHGRFLAPYLELGYLPPTSAKGRPIINCVSRTLEYAYQDKCIATLARRLGDDALADRCDAMSRNLWKLWSDEHKCFAPRDAAGEWVGAFHPLKTVPDFWNDPFFYEGNARQWMWNAQGDIAGLVERLGGPGGFGDALDRFFDPADRDAGQYYSKETMLHVPWLYAWSDRPHKTADRVRDAMAAYFWPTRDGLRDNEDMGCQSAFYICSCIGLYPMMGQDLWLLAAPVFERIELDMGEGGPTLTIEAPGASDRRRYVRSLTINGKPADRAWLRHGEIAGGATLRYELGEEPTSWGRGNPPPPFGAR